MRARARKPGTMSQPRIPKLVFPVKALPYSELGKDAINSQLAKFNASLFDIEVCVREEFSGTTPSHEPWRNTMEPLRLLVADDHESCARVCARSEAQPGWQVAGEASDGARP